MVLRRSISHADLSATGRAEIAKLPVMELPRAGTIKAKRNSQGLRLLRDLGLEGTCKQTSTLSWFPLIKARSGLEHARSIKCL
jgi:hypothetical protein